MIYITVEIQTSPVALRYFGGHDLGDSHKGVMGIFQVVENDPKSSIYGVILRMRKRTLNRAYAPMSSHPEIGRAHV